MSNSFTCLVKSKPVEQEVSRTVILPPKVSVLWLDQCSWLACNFAHNNLSSFNRVSDILPRQV